MEILSNPLFPRKLTRYVEFGLAAYGMYTEGKKLYTWGNGLVEKYKDRESYTIVIKDQDLWHILTDSVTGQLAVADNRVQEMKLNSSWTGVRTSPVFQEVDHFMLGVHKIKVIVEEKEETITQDNRGVMVYTQPQESYKLKAADFAGFTALKDHLTKILSSRNQVEEIDTNIVNSTFYSLKSASTITNNFFRYKNFRCRPPETVFLDADTKEEVLSDLATFAEGQEKYLDFGIPYRRGYLFHGPPGTGKSSLVSMIAGVTRRAVFNITLNDIRSDRMLSEIMAEIDEGNIILFEDVDSFRAAKTRDEESDSKDDDHGVTLSGLLNTLDGLETMQNTIVIMTTNHIEKLDPALIRPGRIDKIIEIGFLTGNQLSKMVEAFTGTNHNYTIPEGKQVTPATVIEAFKRNFFSLENVNGEILELINS